MKTTVNKHIMFVAGETSGDLHAAQVIKELYLRPENKHLRITGMGGTAMQDAGADLVVHANKFAIVGVLEVLRYYPRLLNRLRQLKTSLINDPPDLLVLVDYPEFNLRLAAEAKKLGITVLFYISPQIWAWRPRRIHRIKRVVNKMAVIFPFEEELYRAAGVDASYVGHPLLDSEIPQAQGGNSNQVLLMPGSRRQELNRHLPVMCQAAKQIQAQLPHINFALVAAPGIHEDTLTEQLRAQEFDCPIIKQERRQAMAQARLALCASGTATLELGLIGTPMVIIYKMSALSFFIMHKMLQVKDVGLVNIVLQRRVVPELLQQKATPSVLAKEALKLLTEPHYEQQMRDNLQQLRQHLSQGAAKNLAEVISELDLSLESAG